MEIIFCPSLAKVCITTHNISLPSKCQQVYITPTWITFPRFVSSTVDQNQRSLYRLKRLLSYKPNCRDILILQQNRRLNCFSPATFPHKQRHFKNSSLRTVQTAYFGSEAILLKAPELIYQADFCISRFFNLTLSTHASACVCTLVGLGMN